MTNQCKHITNLREVRHIIESFTDRTLIYAVSIMPYQLQSTLCPVRPGDVKFIVNTSQVYSQHFHYVVNAMSCHARGCHVYCQHQSSLQSTLPLNNHTPPPPPPKKKKKKKKKTGSTNGDWQSAFSNYIPTYKTNPVQYQNSVMLIRKTTCWEVDFSRVVKLPSRKGPGRKKKKGGLRDEQTFKGTGSSHRPDNNTAQGHKIPNILT